MKALKEYRKPAAPGKQDTVQTSVNITRDQKSDLDAQNLNLSEMVRDMLSSLGVGKRKDTKNGKS